MDYGPCRIEGCPRPAKIKRDRLCGGHYRRQWDGRPLDGRVRSAEPVECCLEGCDNVVRTSHDRPLCGVHRQRRATGDYSPVRVAPVHCAVKGCEKPPRTHGWCSGHYAQHRRGVPIRPFKEAGRSVNKGGYVTLYMPGQDGVPKSGRIMEHRWVMQQHLGRVLLATENVHHRNGVRDDNRIENLELWVTTQPCGQRPADLVAWAQQLIEQYGPLVAACDPVTVS